MAYRLIACDLDGTLLSPDQTLSPENQEAIRHLTEKGVVFAIATGRTMGEIPSILRDDPLIRYIIFSGGAMVYDRTVGIIHSACIRDRLKKELLDALFSSCTYLVAHSNGQCYYDASRMSEEDFRRCRVPEYFRKVFELDVGIESNFEEFCYQLPELEQITVFFGDQDDQDRFREVFSKTGQLEIVHSAPTNYEICHIDAGKGKSVQHLAAMLNIPMEEVIAVGDSPNDRSMLEVAGLGLAVANGKEALSDCADAFICSNREPIARYILEHYIP